MTHHSPKVPSGYLLLIHWDTDQHEFSFARFMNEPDFQEAVTKWMAGEAYGRLRDEP